MAPAEVVLGTLTGIDEAGSPLVDFPGNIKGVPIVALTTAVCDAAAVGRGVALLFADGDPARPVILGLIHAPVEGTAATPLPEAVVDGERVVISAQREIVLTCGKASIILTRAGKIILRGTYLLSRSSGVNRIKGGSVQIN